jgi:hypothetical protein
MVVAHTVDRPELQDRHPARAGTPPVPALRQHRWPARAGAPPVPAPAPIQMGVRRSARGRSATRRDQDRPIVGPDRAGGRATVLLDTTDREKIAMRHLWSLLLALGLTPMIYAAAGVSAARLADARQLGASAGIGLGAAFVAGALYALLVMVRLSPVGPVVAGLAYVGVTIWSLLDWNGFTSLIPADLFGETGALHRPVGMGTALLAAPLILTVFSPRRWRRSAAPAAPVYDAAPVYPSTEVSAAPSYADTAVSAAPSYTPSYASSSSLDSAAPSYEPPVYTPPTSSPSESQS